MLQSKYCECFRTNPTFGPNYFVAHQSMIITGTRFASRKHIVLTLFLTRATFYPVSTTGYWVSIGLCELRAYCSTRNCLFVVRLTLEDLYSVLLQRISRSIGLDSKIGGEIFLALHGTCDYNYEDDASERENENEDDRKEDNGDRKPGNGPKVSCLRLQHALPLMFNNVSGRWYTQTETHREFSRNLESRRRWNCPSRDEGIIICHLGVDSVSPPLFSSPFRTFHTHFLLLTSPNHSTLRSMVPHTYPTNVEDPPPQTTHPSQMPAPPMGCSQN